MKVLFVICFVVVVCMIIANIIWDIALTERERKCNADLLDLSQKFGKLRSKEAAVEKLLQDKELELKKYEEALNQECHRLVEWDKRLAEEAETLAKKAKEFEIHKASVKADGTLSEKVAAVVEERIKKPKKEKKI